MVASVSRCRLPSVSRCTCSASRYSDPAAAKSPLSSNRQARLSMELSVSRCRLPSVSRNPFSASRSNCSAPARSPLASSSTPSDLMTRSV
eukprot:scaffold90512_cov72-Phaeocystis_antarctica.AAC.2